jgi:DNA-binding MarR family transcriptional regulator
MADTQYLNRLLLEAFRSVDAQVAGALEARGASNLSPRHAVALLLVDRKGSRLTDLATRAGITKQAMMQIVDDLEVMGHVRRTADPSDARAKIVRLTPKGQRERTEAGRAVSSVEARLRRRLGPERFELLKTTLAGLRA